MAGFGAKWTDCVAHNEPGPMHRPESVALLLFEAFSSEKERLREQELCERSFVGNCSGFMV